MALWLGIDLGTTNSVVAIMDGLEPKLVLNEEGQRLTPSVVTFMQDGGIAVGSIARRQAVTQPDRTIHSVKRILGRRYEDVAEQAGLFSWKLSELANGDAGVLVDGRALAPAEVSAHLLRKLRLAAEEHFGEPVTGAVVTVPAYFDAAQRKATRQACELAGLEVRRIINEPTAAALAYGLGDKRNVKVAVYDFGGGTFDLSLLEFDDDIIEVRATVGDTALGGDDVDNLLLERFFKAIESEHGVDLRGDKVAQQRLRDSAERAKIALSNSMTTDVQVPFLQSADGKSLHFSMTLNRLELESMMASLIGRTITCCESALADAGWKPEDIDEIVLVGGSTKIPLVRQRVERFFGREAGAGLNPDEVVAMGAAVQASILSGEGADFDLMLLDVTPLSLSVETRGGLAVRLIERNTTIPTRARKTFGTAADNQKAVSIHVVQGERSLARENRSLGRFELGGLPALPRSQAKVEVSFDIDANGIVSVTAIEKTTQSKATIQITDAGGLDSEVIERHLRDAERYAQDDARIREEMERSSRLQGWLERLESEPRLVDALDGEGRDQWDEIRLAIREAIADGAQPTAAKAAELESKAIDVATLLEDRRIALAARQNKPKEQLEG